MFPQQSSKDGNNIYRFNNYTAMLVQLWTNYLTLTRFSCQPIREKERGEGGGMLDFYPGETFSWHKRELTTRQN